MRNRRTIFAVTPLLLSAMLLCAALLGAMSSPLRAQETVPIAIAKSVLSKSGKPPKANFEVLSMLPTGIQVRSLANGYEIHTFSYSDAIRTRMLNMLQKNAGYQYGDKVEIVYEPNSQVALKIKGKPSKPL